MPLFPSPSTRRTGRSPASWFGHGSSMPTTGHTSAHRGLRRFKRRWRLWRRERAGGSDIAGAIVDYAEKNSYHHIVTGSAGLTGAKRLLLGSVAADIVTLAHCPVTVVR